MFVYLFLSYQSFAYLLQFLLGGMFLSLFVFLTFVIIVVVLRERENIKNIKLDERWGGSGRSWGG